MDRDWAGHIELDQPVTNSWAGWPSAVGIVPYLRLRATVGGEPDPQTGYVCNISQLDALLRRHAIPLVAAKLREEGWRMSAERLLCAIFAGVHGATPAGVRLLGLGLLPTPFLRYTIYREAPGMVYVTQQFEFSAAHRLHCAALSDEENRRTFGKCNNPNGHGHNYVLEVTVCGEPAASTGVVLALPAFERIVQREVIERLDHKHLNVDTELFATRNPSVENIARVVWELLDGTLGPVRLANVRVYETAKTWADYAAVE